MKNISIKMFNYNKLTDFNVLGIFDPLTRLTTFQILDTYIIIIFLCETKMFIFIAKTEFYENRNSKFIQIKNDETDKTFFGFFKIFAENL